MSESVVAPAPLVEKFMLPPVNEFYTFGKKTLGYIAVGLFLSSQAVPLIFVSIIPPVLS